MNRRPTPAAAGPALERELRALEEQAASAVAGFDAQFYNRAGDLCVDAGLGDRALGYYGRAIDAYLKAGRWDPAAAVCRKLLRVSPGAVRARCTLAWLSIGKGWAADAQRHLDEYLEAARRTSNEAMAIKHLRLMGEATTDAKVRAALADHLQALGDEEGAAALADAIALGEGIPRLGEADDSEERWAKVLRAALMGPDELSDA